MRNRLKSMITEKLNQYGLLPSVEQRSKMTPAEVVAHIAQAVAKWRQNDGFLHDGVDNEVGHPIYAPTCN